MEAGGRLDVPAHHEEADGLVVEQHGAGPGLALRCCAASTNEWATLETKRS